MDNITHALHGLALYALAMTNPSLAQDPTAQSAVIWATALGSQAPDFDFVIRLVGGEVPYLRHHRGITHSIPAWLAWPTLFAILLSLFFPGHFWLIWVWSLLGVLVHVGMDLLTTYGTVAFWPFSGKRVGWDILMIVDIVLWAFGALGIYLWSDGYTPREVLLYALAPSLLYIALRALIQLVLRKRVRQSFPGQRIHRLSVIPSFGLNAWNMVVDAEQGFHVGKMYLRKGIAVEKTFDKKHHFDIDPRWLQNAEQQSEIYRVFTWFARHLQIEAHPLEDGGVRLDLADLAYRMRDRMAFTAHVVLDAEGNVVEDCLGDKRMKKRKLKQT
ncbi:metal-dependent hydrolase [Tumebacillus permanentifrigoris]|uniref:Inner membrane protein n=1 Tax=Tumebacillus permanentifrigoris TaxID=378543 RepID=A0A316D3Q8_9BACL|nr:metal-dependent hydrolase [Tumebacillus permanentifrigoris]PWK05419.1 inner membrane protein [Tumebacillus permanentifrigoris]